jgi:hypothetical protein
VTDRPGPIECATAAHVDDFLPGPETRQQALDAIAMAKILDGPEPVLKDAAMTRLLDTLEGLHCICTEECPSRGRHLTVVPPT